MAYGYIAYDERASRRRDSLANYNDFTAGSLLPPPSTGIVALDEPVFLFIFLNARRLLLYITLSLLLVFLVEKKESKIHETARSDRSHRRGYTKRVENGKEQKV